MKTLIILFILWVLLAIYVAVYAEDITAESIKDSGNKAEEVFDLTPVDLEAGELPVFATDYSYRPKYFQIQCNTGWIRINTKDGTVTYKDCDLDEAGKALFDIFKKYMEGCK